MVSVGSCGRLISIPTIEWIELRNVYRHSWPLNANSFFSLDNCVKWSNKDLKLCEREIHIWSIDDNWREHGIYILEDHTKHTHVIRMDVCSQQHFALFFSALKHLDTVPYKELIFREKTSTIVKKHLTGLGCVLINDCYPAKLFYLSKESCHKLDVKQHEDFIFKPLTLVDAQQINEYWAFKRTGSRYIIERNIKYNLSLGAYHSVSGELCAWVLHNELGVIGFLCVKPDFRRRGLAEMLLKQFCRKIAEQDTAAAAHIVETNVSSIRLFTKLGFETSEYNYWFVKEEFLDV